MKKKAILKVLLLTVLINLFSGLLFAMPKDQNCRLIEELNISKDKISQIKETMESHHAKQRERMIEVRQIRDQLENEITKENPNKQSVQEYTQKINQLRSKMLEDRINETLKFRDELTPEQRKKLSNIERDQMLKRHHFQQKKQSFFGKMMMKNDKKNEKRRGFYSKPEEQCKEFKY